RARPLPPLVVDPAFDAAGLAVEPGGDRRADRREGVEALAARVLRLFLLQIAGGHVVDAGQPEHVIPRVRRLHAMRAAPDYNAELGFVIDAADAGRDANCLAGADDGGRRLDEEERFGRQRLADLAGVILVVEADADDLRGPDRRQHAHAAKTAAHRGAGRQRGAAADRIAAGAPQLAVAFDGKEGLTILLDTVDAIHPGHFTAISH